MESTLNANNDITTVHLGRHRRDRRANATTLTVMFTLTIGGLVLGAIGCRLKPRAATGSDVCPIQLEPRQKTKKSGSINTMAEATETQGPSTARNKPKLKTTMAPTILVDQSEPGTPTPEASSSVVQAMVASEPLAIVAQQTPGQGPSPAPATVPSQEPVVPILSQPDMADEPVLVNFENVDIRTVLKTIGEITGINFIPHESVTGTVTVMSPSPIRLGDIYGFLQSILDVQGLAAVETDNAVKIIPKADAVKQSPQVRIGADPRYIPRNDAIVTQIMPLKYADATEIAQIADSMLANSANMSVYPRTNSIMVTDTSANIHHIACIIEQLDIEGSREKVLLFPLTYASAQVVSEQINNILNNNQAGTPQTPGRGRGVSPISGRNQVLPDERTNSLIVMGGEQDIEMIQDLVAQIDVQRPTGMDNVHVTYLKNADANEVAPSLEAALASMRLTGNLDQTQQIEVTANDSTNSLIIVASPQDYDMISGIIEKLDIVRDQVLVEMMILEISEESLKQIGIDWATLDEAVTDSVRGFAATNFGPRVDYLNGDLEGLAVGAWKNNGSDISIGAIVHALQSEQAVNILSTPLLLTQNHRKANIVVGENRPYVVKTRITETTDFLTPTAIKEYEYKDVGITLAVTPHISQGGLIRLEVDSEFTKLIETVTSGSVDTPVTAKRNAQTTITMASGTTAVIGGLIRDDITKVEDKIPILGDLPFLGSLFRSNGEFVQKTNLLIFITPYVMTNQEDLVEMSQTKRDQMPMLLNEER